MIFLQNEYFNSYNIAQIGSGDKPSNGKQGKFYARQGRRSVNLHRNSDNAKEKCENSMKFVD